MKYSETRPPNFQKQVYNRFFPERGLGENDLSR